MSKFGMGQPVRRVEDVRFVQGKGKYSDDVAFDGQAWLAVIRSPHPHALIKGIDKSEAEASPGVLLVMTGADLEAMGDNAIPCEAPVDNRDGTPMKLPRHAVLVTDKARHVGDPVAFVVAETRGQAKDAAELVMVDYEELEAVADTAQALSSGDPIHEGGNLAFHWQHGDSARTDEAFAKAAHVTKLELINNRVVANAMEPRAATATFIDGQLTVHTATQGPWGFRDTLASNLGLATDKVRVVTPDVGGGFGMKAQFYAEYTMVAAAAMKLGRPVKWTSERGEAFLTDTQGRDNVVTAELAFDAGNRITAMRVLNIASMGAYSAGFGPFVPTLAALKVLPGVYDIPLLTYEVQGVYTNTVRVDAYRGAGRPESIYCVERIIEKAAVELGMDRTELRRLNFIKPEQMPYTSSAAEVYDVGEFARIMDASMANADWAGFEQRRKESAARGVYRGIGMCYYIESTMGDPSEGATVKFEADGLVTIRVGTQSNGQGHETAYAQVLHAKLGVPFEQIRIIQGDTALVKQGGGTGGSRSLTAQGMAIIDASAKVIEKGKAYAAQHFETAVQDIAFTAEDGTFRVAGTDRVIDIMALAKTARAMTVPGVEEGLDADATHVLPAWTFPNGCHIAEVEVDPATGHVKLANYTVVDDFGVILNPMLVEGQVHGGIVQGLGQALYEHTVYDEAGQLLSGSFMDYAMPRADDVPFFGFSTIEVPCKNNGMGVKGCGEAGSVGSCAAVINAIIDALNPLGVTQIDMPATPEIVWRTISSAQTSRAA